MSDKLKMSLIPGVGVFLTLLVTGMVLHYELQVVKEKFAKETTYSTELIKHNLADIAMADDKLGFLFQVNDDVVEDDFAIHSRAILSQFDFIDKIFFANKIRSRFRESEEKMLQYQGYTGFRFRPFPPPLAKNSEFPDVLFPVKFIQPFNPYTATWFGRDLLTFKPAQAVLHTVVTQGKKMQFLISGQLNDRYLLSAVSFIDERTKPEPDDVFGILAYRVALGKLLAPLENTDNIVSRIDLNGKSIFSSGEFAQDALLPLLRSDLIDFEGQKLLVTYQLPDPLAYIDYRMASLTLALGLLITLFAFFLEKHHLEKHKLLSEQNRLVEQKVKEKTRQLEEQARQLSQAYNHQVAVSKELESFSYSISHDLRAPLRSISSFSSILMEDYHDLLDEEAQDLLQRIERGAKRMSSLIDDLLDLSTISRQALKYEQFSISKLVKEIIDDMRNNHPEYSFDIKVENNLTTEADRGLLRIALENLLSNAIKYSSKSDHPTIEFGSLRQDNKTVFYIKDNGVGFDMDYANKLFVAFHRLHGKEFEGTGIGLAIVQRVVDRHGGKIWAESAPGEGATFYFTLSVR